ncbi:helix-turn-helix transcriptional regulator [Prosthecomicrobium hirschii]|uniref:helix-turn-helix transcriptional regulator n=1 Tax=Prosthecodimorpha hirschii TaxID=665126 RepID=UPI002220A521|nr:helix-turn-helix domain-containing protein [Prosthecomicrobium hirschii]MCW1841917.1 helix-turn-helix domain-containing protein [Prosthecomicrobium hirschii]
MALKPRRTPRSYSPTTKEALAVMGGQIRLARKEHGMTQVELAERMGVSRNTLLAIEKGHPTSEIGLVFEAAVLVGVPLFGDDTATLQFHRTRIDDKLALMPKSIHSDHRPVKDDF